MNEKKRERNEAGSGLGYYPTGSRYNGKLYRDTAGLRHVGWLGKSMSRYNQLYRDRRRLDLVGGKRISIDLDVSWQEQRLGCWGHDKINCIVT